MELYRKKVNINKPNKKGKDKSLNPRNDQKNIYIQKMIQKSQPENEGLDLSSAGDNIHNIRTNMEDIFSNDENKRKAIKYVIQQGKNKSIRNSPKIRDERFEKSNSPHNKGNKSQYISGNVESFRTTPNRINNYGRGYNTEKNRMPLNENKSYVNIPNTVSNFYNPKQRNMNNINTIYNQNKSQNPITNFNDGDDGEYYDSQMNNIYPEEGQNEYESSSMNNIDDRYMKPSHKYSRSPDPRMANRIPEVLNERYQKAEMQQNYPYKRNKDIQMAPNKRNMPNNYTNINPNLEDEIDELIKTIEDMQSVINGQKNQIKNNVKELNRKNKEINFLKNELNNAQKELDDKRMEYDKDLENAFDNNNNLNLKNEYFKLLQDYENNINDYNNLKDDYNKIVDEFNNIKNNNKNLIDDNKNLRQNNQKL